MVNDSADVFYRCCDYYPGDEAAIRWDCSNLVMKWSLSEQ
ncbi:hypothetical protein ACET7J_02250 [Aeromonas veronii]